MAQMVKAIRMILGRDSFGANSKQLKKSCMDIEIEDDVPRRKPSLEEIDALEVMSLASSFQRFLFMCISRKINYF